MPHRFDEPGWWYSTEPSALVAMLRPLERLYGWAAERRLHRARPYRCELPVVCAGNFTAGGTGKTPLARYLAQHLTRLGERPVLLTRGYGGRERGPKRVDAERDMA
ncbi:MAG: tetraacyldisaccharide 4'-kinase, partial [Hyphomicrobiaceae bacterium]